MEDVRRVGEQVRPHVLHFVGLRELGEVLPDALLGVPPGEVAIRLRIPPLASRCMTFGRVNASARKIVSGCRSQTSLMTQSQKTNGLVCGLSTRKTFTPWPIQNRKTSRSSAQRASQSSHSKSIGVDVLVLLRRVLRVLDRAVRPVAEPLGMLADVRVIRRALEGDVQRDLQPLAPGHLDEVVEVLQRAEFRVDRLVPPLRAADRPGAPGSPGPGVSVLFGPCGKPGRSGGSAAGTGRRTPCSRHTGGAPPCP